MFAFASEVELQQAAKAVRSEGFRARLVSSDEMGEAETDENLLEVFRYYKPAPGGELSNGDMLESATAVLANSPVQEFRQRVELAVVGLDDLIGSTLSMASPYGCSPSG